MKRKVRELFLPVLILVICFFTAWRILAAAQDMKKSTPKAEPILHEQDFLQTSGDSIVNQNNEIVRLQGVNLGGWLLQEYWMCPVFGKIEIEKWTQLETLQVLEERFGKKRAQNLIEIYQENWITEDDFARIAELGFNTVRLPFWYRNFYSDDFGTWINHDKSDGNPGILALDWAIEMAGKYGLYVILDMHGCPGGQTGDHTCGNARQCHLYASENDQQLMEELWITIAERYRDNPIVAGYDIMNEPGSEGIDPATSHDMRNDVYDRMIHAIRTVDSRHIVIVEAMWDLSVLPFPEDTDWENVVYSLHSYGTKDKEAYVNSLMDYGKEHQVPMYLGEFSALSYWPILKDSEISYTAWGYKGSQFVGDEWFFWYAENAENVDVYNDSYREIKRKWGEVLQTGNLSENEALINAVSEALH